MTIKQILFTKKDTAELVDVPLREIDENEVLVKTLYTAISAGTEYANLVGDPNVVALNANNKVSFPRELGYCGVGIVEKIGSNVKSVDIGDNVIICFGKHAQYNVMPESDVYKFEGIEPLEVALTVIAAFPMLAIRRTELEIGEPVMIFGLGILGLLAVQLCKSAGAYPIIAVDLDEKRRQLAKEMGADYVLNSKDENFKQTVLDLTNGKGVPVVIEGTGVGAALTQALGCTAKMGRVALMGCTRKPVNEFDFYHLVHGTGITLIGTNNVARAKLESRHGCWTMRDDCLAIVNLTKGNRISQKVLINEIHSPEEAFDVYTRLANDYYNFPIGVIFDWSKI